MLLLPVLGPILFKGVQGSAGVTWLPATMPTVALFPAWEPGSSGLCLFPATATLFWTSEDLLTYGHRELGMLAAGIDITLRNGMNMGK